MHAGAENFDPRDRAVQAVVVAIGALHVHLEVADELLGTMAREGLFRRHGTRHGEN